MPRSMAGASRLVWGGPAWLLAAQNFERFARGQRVGDVAEIDAAHDLLRRHIRKELPDGLALGLGPEVPDGVHHGRGGKMDYAFFGADPAKLAVAHYVSPERAHVFGE